MTLLNAIWIFYSELTQNFVHFYARAIQVNYLRI